MPRFAITSGYEGFCGLANISRNLARIISVLRIFVRLALSMLFIEYEVVLISLAAE